MGTNQCTHMPWGRHSACPSGLSPIEWLACGFTGQLLSSLSGAGLLRLHF